MWLSGTKPTCQCRDLRDCLFDPRVWKMSWSGAWKPIPVHFRSLIPIMSMFTLAISFDHFQFALIHGPDIPGSYAILLFTALDLAFSYYLN